MVWQNNASIASPASSAEPDYAEVELAQLLRITVSNLELAARAKGVCCIVQAPAQLWAQVDPGRVERVVLNLLSNALKVTPEGGCVRVAARADEAHGRVVIEVADTGPGIPADERETVSRRSRNEKGRQSSLTGPASASPSHGSSAYSTAGPSRSRMHPKGAPSSS